MLLGLILAVVVGGAASPMHPATLRCEYRDNPIGIDVRKPRLSWTLESDRRGEKQTAYEIVVADSEKAVRAHQGDLWGSGKVRSDHTVHVVYGGKPLPSGQRAWWSVHVWDKDGKDCGWSAPAFWEMGLLKPEDWKAQWIGGATEGKQAAESQADVKWVWYPEGNP